MNEIIEFRVWKKWVAEHGRCQGVTAKGRQCKNQCHGWGSDICNEDDFHTVPFILGVTDRCRVHRLHAPEPAASPAEIQRLLSLLEEGG